MPKIRFVFLSEVICRGGFDAAERAVRQRTRAIFWLMARLIILKCAHDLSDKALCASTG